jgi:excisionase family DNA binding protein
MTTRTNPVGAADLGAARLLRIEDVADRLTVSRSMAWKLVAAGELRSVRIGRSVRVRPADLEAYLSDPARER